MKTKKRKTLAVLSALGLCASLGIALGTSQPTYAYSNPEAVQLASYNLAAQDVSAVRTRTDLLFDSWAANPINTEMHGLKYEIAGDVTTVSNVANPEEVTELFLPSTVYRTRSSKREITSLNLDLSKYTNLEKVILLGDTSAAKYAQYVNAIGHDVDLYVSGNITGLDGITNIKTLTMCGVYDSGATLDGIKTVLAQTHCTTLRYADWTSNWFSAYNNPTNINGETVTRKLINAEELGFSMDCFYPYGTFKDTLTSNKLIKISYLVHNTNTDTFGGETFYVKELYSGVNTFVTSSSMEFGMTLRNAPEMIVIPDDNSLSSNNVMNNDNTTSYVFTSPSITDPNFIPFHHATDIWFAPKTEPYELTSFGYNLNYNSSLKIHIPNQYKDKYSAITGSSSFADRIEYYDYDASLFENKVKLTDNNVYKIYNTNYYTVDELNEIKTFLESKGYTFTTEDYIDTQIKITMAQYNESLSENPSTGEEENNNPGTGNQGSSDTPTQGVVADDLSGYHALGSIYYSSDKSIEDVLSIAGNYILMKDGTRYDQINDIKVSFLVHDGRLSTTVTKDAEILSSVDCPLHKLDTSEYGEFIYLQDYSSTNGVLLYDTDSRSAKNINDIYEYIIKESTNVTTFNKTTAEATLTTPMALDLATTYVHENGNTYNAKAEVLAFDLDEAVGFNENISVKLQSVMSPDDDKNDPESIYKVKTITGIYLPATLSAHGVPSAINESIITQNDEAYSGNPIIHMVTSTNKHDGSNYTIDVQGTLPDNIIYKHQIPVTILPSIYKEAFAVCSDGTVIVVKHLSTELTTDTLKTDINKFCNEVLKKEGSVTLAEGLDLSTNKTTKGSKFGTSNVDIVVSGIAVLQESSESRPVDMTDIKKGFTALSSLTFSSDFKVDDAAKLVADKILYYNGQPYQGEYDVKVSVKNQLITFIFTDKDGEKLYSVASSYKVVKNSKYSFICANSSYNTGIIISPVKDVKVGDFMNEIMKEVVSLPEYTFSSNTSMTETGNTNLTGTYKHINQNYYAYDYTVEVMDTKKAIADSKIEVETQSISEQIKDKTDEIVNSFKEKFENNKAFKIAMMATGTILGILLICGIFLIIRKFCKWLKR